MVPGVAPEGKVRVDYSPVPVRFKDGTVVATGQPLLRTQRVDGRLQRPRGGGQRPRLVVHDTQPVPVEQVAPALGFNNGYFPGASFGDRLTGGRIG